MKSMNLQLENYRVEMIGAFHSFNQAKNNWQRDSLWDRYVILRERFMRLRASLTGTRYTSLAEEIGMNLERQKKDAERKRKERAQFKNENYGSANSSGNVIFKTHQRGI